MSFFVWWKQKSLGSKCRENFINGQQSNSLQLLKCHCSRKFFELTKWNPKLDHNKNLDRNYWMHTMYVFSLSFMHFQSFSKNDTLMNKYNFYCSYFLHSFRSLDWFLVETCRFSVIFLGFKELHFDLTTSYLSHFYSQRIPL